MRLDPIGDSLQRLLRAWESRPRGKFDWSIRAISPKNGRRQVVLDIDLTTEEKVRITVNPKTPAGHPVQLDGALQVSVQSGDGSVVIDPADPMSFYIVSGDDPGDTAVLVSGDADIGAGVETISDLVIAHVAGARASSLGMSFGPPELKETPTP